MNKKLLIHLCILAGLILYTIFAYQKSERERVQAEKDRQEKFESSDLDPFEEARLAEEGDNSVSSMYKVGGPLFISIVYAGILFVVYVFPVMVDKMSQGLMGSGAEMETDPLQGARSAVAQGEYEEAMKIYREVWEGEKENRFPLVEIVKIQRENLEDPQAAIKTLRDALKEEDWRENDKAFFYFRISEIYEEDLDDLESAKKTLGEVTEELPETRHAANAAHKLRKMEEA